MYDIHKRERIEFMIHSSLFMKIKQLKTGYSLTP